MAGLQQLRKRLKSIRATGQLAEAMRTAATIKYSRVSKVREEFTPYASGSADMLSLLGRFGICREADRIAPKNCLVLFGSNRGLCGGFNAELFRFMDRVLAAEDEAPHIISCSRKARPLTFTATAYTSRSAMMRPDTGADRSAFTAAIFRRCSRWATARRTRCCTARPCFTPWCTAVLPPCGTM